MKILGINGSPRKNWNTDILINKSLEGAKSQGAEAEIIHLYDLKFKGCISCFACKQINGKSYGKCAVKDDLASVFEKIEKADALILGSPIYFGEVTGEMRSFLERLFFQYLVYDKERTILMPKKIPTAFIYTMNVPKHLAKEVGYEEKFKKYEGLFQRFFGSSESLIAADTLQFHDYSKYVSTMFNAEEKAKSRKELFPIDCKKAFDMGAKLVKRA
ncbi:multimeric flavodoxin WrbA [Clostridium pascui]|uniref:flavodoxin family protein n=1 Tax=Clostridium pascui TaxID=46609 RepID=UPI00195CE296|nr:flavodoxin family protein [Clostridium pascui]MBM7868561.1 multimeric flavodoxin WrbA [Clostridium pascui]